MKIITIITVCFFFIFFIILGFIQCDKNYKNKEEYNLKNTDSLYEYPKIKIITTPGYNTGLRYDLQSGEIKFLPDFDGWD